MQKEKQTVTVLCALLPFKQWGDMGRSQCSAHIGCVSAVCLPYSPAALPVASSLLFSPSRVCFSPRSGSTVSSATHRGLTSLKRGTRRKHAVDGTARSGHTSLRRESSATLGLSHRRSMSRPSDSSNFAVCSRCCQSAKSVEASSDPSKQLCFNCNRADYGNYGSLRDLSDHAANEQKKKSACQECGYPLTHDVCESCRKWELIEDDRESIASAAASAKESLRKYFPEVSFEFDESLVRTIVDFNSNFQLDPYRLNASKVLFITAFGPTAVHRKLVNQFWSSK